jgi:hypothetical protein
MKRNILIVAIVIVIIALVGIFAFTQQSPTHDGKLNTEIEFLSESTLKNGESVRFLLKDEKNNALPGQNVTIVFVENGENQTYGISTDNGGKGALSINNELPGEYEVIVSYNGTNVVNGCVAHLNLTIEEGYSEGNSDSDGNSSAESISSNSSAGTALYNTGNSSDTQLHYDSQYNFYYDDNGIVRGGQNDGYSADYIRDIYENGDMVDEEGNLQ